MSTMRRSDCHSCKREKETVKQTRTQLTAVTTTAIHRTLVMRGKPLRDVGVVPAVVAGAAPHQPVRRLLAHYASPPPPSPTRKRTQRAREQLPLARDADGRLQTLRLPRRRVGVQRQNLRVAVRTHDHATPQSPPKPEPRNEPLGVLALVGYDLSILRVDPALEGTAFAEQTGLTQQVEITMPHARQKSALLYPQLTLLVHVIVVQRQHRHRLHVARPVHEVLRSHSPHDATCNNC